MSGFRYYTRDKKGKLRNTAYVDNSYKWAGGGMISTAADLVQFANVVLFSYQDNSNSEANSYLQQATVSEMWSLVKHTEKKGQGYGMGWAVVPQRNLFGGAEDKPFYVYHTGGAIGACSVLLVLPRSQSLKTKSCVGPPQGVCVAILCNLQGINLEPVALKIAQEFEKCIR